MVPLVFNSWLLVDEKPHLSMHAGYEQFVGKLFVLRIEPRNHEIFVPRKLPAIQYVDLYNTLSGHMTFLKINHVYLITYTNELYCKIRFQTCAIESIVFVCNSAC